MKKLLSFVLIGITVLFGCKKDQVADTVLQSPELSAFSIPSKTFNEKPFKITSPKSNSNGTFSYTSSDVKVATVKGDSLIITGTGSAVITANQAATNTHKADSIKATFMVGQAASVLSDFTLPDKQVYDADFAIPAPKTNRSGKFSYSSSNASVAIIKGNTITITGKGQSTITATQEAATGYAPATITAVLTVKEGSVTDIDGNTYATIKIGNQIWMAENLKVTRYNDGTALPNVKDDTEWRLLTTGALCEYKNDPEISKVYGKLYNWYAVNDTRKLAPKGWHIPSDAEWDALHQFVGGRREDGHELQEQGTKHWRVDTGGTNSTFFNAIPGGGRIFSYSGVFDSIGFDAYWWSTTPGNYDNLAWYADLYVKGYFERHEGSKVFGHSVRCIKD